MTNKVWTYILAACLMVLAMPMQARRFFNLTSAEVRVDSVLPHFVYSMPLQGEWRDTVYTVSLKYAEYIDMSPTDIANYNRLSGAVLPREVALRQQVSECRKQGSLRVDFCPLVFCNNRYQILVSFMLDVKATPLKGAGHNARIRSVGSTASSIYAAHSVLAQGSWAKIQVSESGIHQLTEQVVRQAGFSDINKVKIYGYGGNLQDEALFASYLADTDDLHEVEQCVVDGRHYFYAKGPVSWGDKASLQRIRNPYSNYGCYFITQTDDSIATVDSVALLASCYPQPEDYHFLYEKDGFSWYDGGRNLFDPMEIKAGGEQQVVVTNDTGDGHGQLSVAVTSGNASVVEILRNGKSLGTMSLSLSANRGEAASYLHGVENVATYSINDFHQQDTIAVRTLSGSPVHLDYVSVTWNKPRKRSALDAHVPAAQYVYTITNQDHHADGASDLVIIIPTSQKLLQQAQRLKAFHESHDGLRVNIVPADELYNEFSSGTPDANAYRRYLRMLSDKAATEADVPRYLLLFGDCVWDNRMLTSACSKLQADDYLLCHESENSFSSVSCYVSDSWLGILGEGAGAQPTSELQDVAVGRFPVTTVSDAETLVDKTINYSTNANAGAWQNTLMFMGDDGNDNKHMMDANEVADDVATLYPAYLVKKVMWDAYPRETSSTGNTYPEVSDIIKRQQKNGALVMDYAGHGSNTQLSHESVLKLADFENFHNANLPLWVTASCDIMPFDGMAATIGERALLNANGGAVAFYGTTRTVYAQQNKYINRAFMRRVLSVVDGKPVTIGEAHRLAQNDVMTGGVNETETDVTVNHLQYSLLGDPALALNLPMQQVVVDSVNGVPTDKADALAVLKAGSVAKLAGHVVGQNNFQGVVTVTVRDSKEQITCRLNDTSATGAEDPFVYTDRTKTLYTGSDSVRQGKFSFSFAVPKDINYSGDAGLINLYAVSEDKKVRAHGACDKFVVGGSDEVETDSVGPTVYCYLNSTSFVDGENVNTTPFFVANISDKDGINATGSGIGHDLQLVIDGDLSKTYVLNDNFAYDFGTYTSGSVSFSIPELSPGQHQLTFRCWDVQNNSTTATLRFNVVEGLSPNLFDVGVTENPAKSTTTFILSHDRIGSNMEVAIEIYDVSGRQLWRHAEKGVSDSGQYTVKWDLTTGSGSPLGIGVYLYRAKVSADGSGFASKVRKLVIIK